MSDKIYKAKLLEWLELEIQHAKDAARQYNLDENYTEENVALERAEAFGSIFTKIKDEKFDVEGELFSLTDLQNCWIEAERSIEAKTKNGLLHFIAAIRNEREQYANNPADWSVDEHED